MVGSMLRKRLYILVLLLLLLASCSPGGIKRKNLTYKDLMDGFGTQSPLDEGALTIPEGAEPPRHTFEGRLEILGEERVGEVRVLRVMKLSILTSLNSILSSFRAK